MDDPASRSDLLEARARQAGRPWERYVQVEGWEEPYRLSPFYNLWGFAYSILSAVLLLVLYIAAGADPEALKETLVLLLVLLIVFPLVFANSRVMRRCLLRVIPVESQAAVSAVSTVLSQGGAPFSTRSMGRRVRMLGQTFDEVFDLRGGAIWIGVGRPWFAERGAGTQLVLGPTTRENERAIADIAWRLDRGLGALGVVPGTMSRGRGGAAAGRSGT